MSVTDEESYCAWFSDPAIMEGIGPPLSRDRAQAGFHASLRMMSARAPQAWLWIASVDADQESMGLFGIVVRGERHEVGALLAPPHQGRGYAYEALSAVCEFAFVGLRLSALWGHQLSSNRISIGLMEKLGFRAIGGDAGWIDWHLESADWCADDGAKSER